VIHQRRRAIALRWIEELALPSRARVLEVGCGAGLLAIDLARRGYDVDCIDSSKAMVELAAAEAKEADVAGRLSVDIGDVHALGFESGVFDLVIALGVLPFLHSPKTALAQMVRVTRPGGSVILSSDNKFRLNKLLDPRYAPFPGREGLKRLLTDVGAKAPSEVPSALFSYRTAKRMIEDAGFEVDRCVPLGFGPFSVLGANLFREPRAIKVNNWLQERADRSVPGIRSVSAQHLILARKPSPPEAPHSSH
jgi:SAM-dependent methyltransferase